MCRFDRWLRYRAAGSREGSLLKKPCRQARRALSRSRCVRGGGSSRAGKLQPGRGGGLMAPSPWQVPRGRRAGDQATLGT